MADVYVDLSLATGLNDGTSWTNAYQGAAGLATAAGASSAGDNIWVKGQDATSGASRTLSFPNSSGNPVKVIGCKSSPTPSEPPVQSELIPGWRTGETRTEANRAYNDGDIPHIGARTAGGYDIIIDGEAYFYGIKFDADDNIQLAYTNTSVLRFEECGIVYGQTTVGEVYIGSTSVSDEGRVSFINCEFSTADDGNNNIDLRSSCIKEFYGCVIGGRIQTHVVTVDDEENSGADFWGCDFSEYAHTGITQLRNGSVIRFMNCKLHASTALMNGVANPGRVEAWQCDSTTGKTSGTITNFEMVDVHGSIVDDTTSVRTGGANDGTSNHSLAFTPAVNKTRENYEPLVGPWMYFWIDGDGTAQTLSVYINNDSASDYNDDDVWLEVMFPSAAGDTMHTFATTQMDLLGTPSAVTDDTTSTWGGSRTQAQTLSASIDPDYKGVGYCRVCFAKTFAASPDVLYVDPKPVIT